MDYFKHETALIDPGAQIGKDSKIWHWTHICATAKLGEACSLGQNVYVGNHVSIGKRCKIQNNVSVYDEVTLEDDVFCGPSVVFTNVINPRAFIARKTEYLKTLIKRGCTLGANATILCGNTLGEYSFIAAGAVVTRDVKPFALMSGVPARQVGWMSRFGEKIPLPLSGNGEWTCPNLKDRYVLRGDQLTVVFSE